MRKSPYLWEAHSSKTMGVTPESVWALWDRPARWPEWNPAIKSTEFAGPFTQGATTIVRLHRGGTRRFIITELERRRGFTEETYIPGARVAKQHRIREHGDRVEVSHRISLAGPLAGVWGTLIGPRIRRHLDQYLANEERLAWEIEIA